LCFICKSVELHYFISECVVLSEDSVRSACGLTLGAISQYNPDILKRHAALALPLAFFAMHEKGGYDRHSDLCFHCVFVVSVSTIQQF
jgi:hypothetical protein